MRAAATLAQLARATELCAQWDWSIFTVTSGGGSIDKENVDTRVGVKYVSRATGWKGCQNADHSTKM